MGRASEALDKQRRKALVAYLDSTSAKFDGTSLSISYGLPTKEVVKILKSRGRYQNG